MQAITAAVLVGSVDVVAQELARAKNLQFKCSLFLMVSSRMPIAVDFDYFEPLECLHMWNVD